MIFMIIRGHVALTISQLPNNGNSSKFSEVMCNEMLWGYNSWTSASCDLGSLPCYYGNDPYVFKIT